jgi:hypothetical protein
MENKLINETRKQPTLKPQDIVVAIKISLNKHESPTFSQLAGALFLSASEVHSAYRRAIHSNLINLEQGRPTANRTSLREFIIHGLKYAFPAAVGTITRGTLTGLSAAPFRDQFTLTEHIPSVWPDAKGTVQGISLLPLYPSIPDATKLDSKLYQTLVLIDILRTGAARERELAEIEVRKQF